MKVQRQFMLVAVLGLLVATLGACSSADSSTDTTEVTPTEAENPYGASVVDSPLQNETVLRVSVRGTVTEYSLESLERLPVKTVELFEPFIQARSSFTGISLADLFGAVGIEDAESVSTIALNDYRYINTAGEFTASYGLLAYKQNGKSIPMDRGGPIRIVFPDGTPFANVLDAWNWALSSITVE